MSRDPHDILISIETTNQAILAELRHIRTALADSRSRSSVEIRTGTNGRKYDFGCKAYEGSPIIEAEADAVHSFFRVKAELDARQMDEWAETVDALKARA